MINADLDQFLSSGWYSEATLYLNGYTYWCEGYVKGDGNNQKHHLFVSKFRTIVTNEIYTKRVMYNHENVGFEIVFEMDCDTEEELKEEFLKAKIFEGKSFWEVEQEIAWYDEDEPPTIKLEELDEATKQIILKEIKDGK